MMKNLPALVLLLFVLGCQNDTQKSQKTETRGDNWITYATGLSIKKKEGYTLVKVLKPFKGASESLTYAFYSKGTGRPEVVADAYIATPVSSIVCTSTTHIPMLDYLNESAALSGFPTLDYISSAAIRSRIEQGLITELGVDEALNIEALVSLKPEMVMGYSLSGDLGQFSLIEEAGIPVILNAEYLEKHPLGRAEWIKLAGVLFAKEAAADSVFRFIEEQYNATKAIAADVKIRPSVLSGIVYGDSWYLPGGKNYASTLLADAGFDFFWASDSTSAFVPLSFESVFDQAHDAQYWVGVASFTSLEEMAASDSRYTNFRSYKDGEVYSYNKRIGPTGGSEFLELGYLRPDLILKDLVKIGHPALLPNYQLFFHFQLD
jgi:iron complex transport system substrate-binding protein